MDAMISDVSYGIVKFGFFTMMSGMMVFGIILCGLPMIYYDEKKFKLERKGKVYKDKATKGSPEIEGETERGF